MDAAKLKSYAGAFLVGGGIGVSGQAIMELYLYMEVPYARLIMVFTLASCGALLHNLGIYGKLSALAGVGADVPLCGLAAGIAGLVHGARSNGAGPGKALLAGFVPPALVLGSGALLALILALVKTFMIK
ncbi:MAG: SpoVA/SpoVAEb family sporulation membrane protein [Deltaproteobacteria bacterium]|jgi:hypothetical protein|nr:SpoVA/SpoVAEb family sporulation membrane protein [Deltaproteobacteria bacterium]